MKSMSSLLKPLGTIVAIAAMATLAACASTRTQQSAGEVVDDSALTARVKTALTESKDVKARQVDVETFRGVVQLNGFVESSNAKAAATKVASGVKGVREVRNNLIVGEGEETVGAQIDDSMITAKVKTALIGDSRTKAGQINVTTNQGVVQLAGFVDSAGEKSAATEVARAVSGVRDVRNELDVKQGK